MSTRLDAYRQKRNFGRTKEPRGRRGRSRGHEFVVQKHAARALHYDFRLEHGGVLLSWAVPKGPSLDPRVKRLALQTEDHPLEYGDFEGAIPKGEYGGGTVLVWDRGTWDPAGDAEQMYQAGHLSFELHGEKLQGGFHLVRTQGRSAKDGKHSWLLIKRADSAARPGSGNEILGARPESVLTGRSIDEVAMDPDRIWSSRSGGEAEAPTSSSVARFGSRKASVKKALAQPKGARRAKLPKLIEPELATLVAAAPDGAGWLHEIKLDGYRLLARLDRGRVALQSRRGNDWAARLPTVAAAISELPVASGVLDGELVVLGRNGVSNFQSLQNSMDVGKDDACLYFAFDLLFLDGFDLRELPLVERKAILNELLSRAWPGHDRVRFNDHVVGGGPAFFARACELGLEGIISKRTDSSYTSGRTKSWVKAKCLARQEFVIGGFTEPAGSRGHFGALLLGVQENGRLTYAGKVGTGFTRESLRRIAALLEPLEQSKPPFANPPPGSARGVHWVQPKLVAEIEFIERTQDGLVRHATFRGLREDKPPEQIRHERVERPPVEAALPQAPSLDPTRIHLSHPDRILYPEQGITKRELALYYASVSRYMLPHVLNRPLMLVRCPEGALAHCFHQKHPSRGMPTAIERVLLEEKKGPKEHLMIADVEGLIALVQVGALEVHTWGCRADQPDCPDQLVFDLDPDPELPWHRVLEAAWKIRANLAPMGLTGFVKTTGGKGLHVVVPVVPRTPWEAAKRFSSTFVRALVSAEPSKYLMTMTKAKRKGKIFLDYFRNNRGATAACAYSTRARAGAPVSTPIGWDELTPDLRSDRFDLHTVPERLRSINFDPWREFEAARAPLPAYP